MLLQVAKFYHLSHVPDNGDLSSKQTEILTKLEAVAKYWSSEIEIRAWVGPGEWYTPEEKAIMRSNWERQERARNARIIRREVAAIAKTEALLPENIVRRQEEKRKWRVENQKEFFGFIFDEMTAAISDRNDIDSE